MSLDVLLHCRFSKKWTHLIKSIKDTLVNEADLGEVLRTLHQFTHTKTKAALNSGFLKLAIFAMIRQQLGSADEAAYVIMLWPTNPLPHLALQRRCVRRSGPTNPCPGLPCVEGTPHALDSLAR